MVREVGHDRVELRRWRGIASVFTQSFTGSNLAQIISTTAVRFAAAFTCLALFSIQFSLPLSRTPVFHAALEQWGPSRPLSVSDSSGCDALACMWNRKRLYEWEAENGCVHSQREYEPLLSSLNLLLQRLVPVRAKWCGYETYPLYLSGAWFPGYARIYWLLELEMESMHNDLTWVVLREGEGVDGDVGGHIRRVAVDVHTFFGMPGCLNNLNII